MFDIGTSNDIKEGEKKDDDWHLVCISDALGFDGQGAEKLDVPIEDLNNILSQKDGEQFYVSWTFVKGYQLKEFMAGISFFVGILSQRFAKKDPSHVIGGTTIYCTIRPLFAIRISNGEFLTNMRRYIDSSSMDLYKSSANKIK